MKKFIFLDFDGVLHIDGFDGAFFDKIPLLHSTIKPFIDNVEIVISSSWRELHDIEYMKSFFPEEMQNIIVGVTPCFNSREDGAREKEILAYCEEHGIERASWIALDDEEFLFSSHKNLIEVDSDYGIGFGEMKMLEYFLRK